MKEFSISQCIFIRSHLPPVGNSSRKGSTQDRHSLIHTIKTKGSVLSVSIPKLSCSEWLLPRHTELHTHSAYRKSDGCYWDKVGNCTKRARYGVKTLSSDVRRSDLSWSQRYENTLNTEKHSHRKLIRTLPSSFSLWVLNIFIFTLYFLLIKNSRREMLVHAEIYQLCGAECTHRCAQIGS